MADKQRRPQGDAPGQGLEHPFEPAVGRAAGDHREDDAGPGAIPTDVELAMADLVADDQGEVVFFNDSGLRRLVVATHASVVADGDAGTHRTTAGDDVSGFRYVTFDNGVTLYYQPGLDLVVRPG